MATDMLSYRHAFHAGGFADVLKHAVLTHLLRHAVLKPKPVYFLDTHAGAGGYDLGAPMAKKTGEFRQGIERVLAAEAPPPLLAAYLDLVSAANPPNELGFYPGSPALARAILRPQDRIELIELHGTDHNALAGWATPRIAVIGSNQSQIPPPHSTTRSFGPIPGQTPFSTGFRLPGDRSGVPNGTTSISFRPVGSAW